MFRMHLCACADVKKNIIPTVNDNFDIDIIPKIVKIMKDELLL